MFSAALNERTQALMGAALNIKICQGLYLLIFIKFCIKILTYFHFVAYGLTETAVGVTSMMTHDLTYGHCGVPLNSVRYYLKDWKEGGYLSTDKPNPRGEIGEQMCYCSATYSNMLQNSCWGLLCG